MRETFTQARFVDGRVTAGELAPGRGNYQRP